MNEFTVLVIIWLVISIINYIAKKLKKQEDVGTPQVRPATEDHKKEIPTYRPDPFEPHVQTRKIREEEEEEEEEPEQTQESISLTQAKEARSKFKDVIRGPRKMAEKSVAVISPVEELQPSQKRISDGDAIAARDKISHYEIKDKKTLKKAVIWAEILDKPLSKRMPRWMRRW